MKSAAKPSTAALKRILLVDDDRDIIESMRIALQSQGYEVFLARNGNEGLLMAEREDPDLVILDMMMPERSGILVLERLRVTRPVPIRVIMVTANEGGRHRDYAEKLGVDAYLHKPFPIEKLLGEVARLLGPSEPKAPPAEATRTPQTTKRRRADTSGE